MKSWDHLQIYLGTNIHINLGFNNIITNTPPHPNLETMPDT